MKRKGVICYSTLLSSNYIIKYETVESLTTYTLYFKWFIFRKKLYNGKSLTAAYKALEVHYNARNPRKGYK